MRRRLVRIFVVVALWAPVFAFVGHVASGLGPSDLPGFAMGGKADGARWIFESPSLGIPASPTGELDISHSEVTLKSGPASYALGSVAWPGQVVAALPSFLQGEIESQSGNSFSFPFDVPNYPVRAESFYPQGPTRANSQAGTVVMESSAQAGSADAASSLNSFGVPLLGTVGTQSSMASNGFDDQGAFSMVRGAANDISIAGGLVKIQSVVSTATARSDGDRGTVAGTTTVQGASVAGHAVSIDADGVHVEGQGTGTAAIQQAVNGALKSAGLTIELAPPIDRISGASASRDLPGLLVTMNDKAVDRLVSLLPASEQQQIRGQVTFDQEMTITLAPVSVNATAAKAFSEGVPDIGGGVLPSSGGSSVPSSGVAAGDAGGTPVGGSSGSSPLGSSSGAPVVLAASPTLKNFTGVPVWLVIVLVVAAFATARPLMALADRVLFARAGAATCPEER
jgi:hypothetical protein